MHIFEHIEKRAVVGGFIALLLIGTVAWYLLRGSPEEETSSVLTELEGPLFNPVLGRDLLIALSRLNETTLDTAFFEDPLFLGLRDFGVVIAPQPVGRRNPFAAFSAAAAPSRTKTLAPSSPRGTGARGAMPQGGGAREEFDFAF